MKSYITIIATVLITGSVISQSTTVLNQNNVSANLQDEGFELLQLVTRHAGAARLLKLLQVFPLIIREGLFFLVFAVAAPSGGGGYMLIN